MIRALYIIGFVTPFLLLFLAFARSQDTDEARRAIAIVKKADGKLEFDEKAPGRPVVSLNL